MVRDFERKGPCTWRGFVGSWYEKERNQGLTVWTEVVDNEDYLICEEETLSTWDEFTLYADVERCTRRWMLNPNKEFHY